MNPNYPPEAQEVLASLRKVRLADLLYAETTPTRRQLKTIADIRSNVAQCLKLQSGFVDANGHNPDENFDAYMQEFRKVLLETQALTAAALFGAAAGRPQDVVKLAEMYEELFGLVSAISYASYGSSFRNRLDFLFADLTGCPTWMTA